MLVKNRDQVSVLVPGNHVMSNGWQTVFVLCLLLMLVTSATACAKSTNDTELTAESMSIHFLGGRTIRYSNMNDSTQIDQFVAAFLRAKRDHTDVGTTHPIMVELVPTRGKQIRVWGGTQGFQTVLQNGEQFNVRGSALDRYFKNLVLMSKK